MTAGDSVTYNFDFTNGTDAPITTVAASTLGNGIKFDLGNQNLAVVDDKIVNDKCNVPKLGAGGSCTFGLEVLTKDLNPGGGGGNRADWFVTVGGIYFQPDFELVTGKVTTRVCSISNPGARDLGPDDRWRDDALVVRRKFRPHKSSRQAPVEGRELPAFARSVAAGSGTSPRVSWPS